MVEKGVNGTAAAKLGGNGRGGRSVYKEIHRGHREEKVKKPLSSEVQTKKRDGDDMDIDAQTESKKSKKVECFESCEVGLSEQPCGPQ
jgi:hypothetical protein